MVCHFPSQSELHTFVTPSIVVRYMEKIFTSLDIRDPGLRTLPPGVERYYVEGGGLSVLEVLPEDKLDKSIISYPCDSDCMAEFEAEKKRQKSVIIQPE